MCTYSRREVLYKIHHSQDVEELKQLAWLLKEERHLYTDVVFQEITDKLTRRVTEICDAVLNELNRVMDAVNAINND